MTPYQKQRRKVDYYRRERRMVKSGMLRKAHVPAFADIEARPGTYAAWSGTVVSTAIQPTKEDLQKIWDGLKNVTP